MQSAFSDRFPIPWRLVVLGAATGLLYGLMVGAYPLRAYADTPTQNLRLLIDATLFERLALAGGVLALFALFLAGLRAMCAAQQHPHAPRLIVGFALLFTLLLLLVHPVTSSDLYDYLFRGRMVARYGANTFTTAPEAHQSDPLFRLIAWPQAVTAYGPLWEMMSWLVARLAGEARGVPTTPADAAGLVRGLLAYKLLGALGFLLCGRAIWWALSQIAPGQRSVGLYLWLWNPLVLWESVGAGHNDAWMMLPVIVGVGAVAWIAWSRRRATWARQHSSGLETPALGMVHLLTLTWPVARPGLFASAAASVRARARMRLPPADLSALTAAKIALTALALLGVGALIKYVPIFLWPVLLAAACRCLPTWRQRWWLAFGSGLTCLVLIALAYAPFWRGWDTLHNVQDRQAVFTVSWLHALSWLLTTLGVGFGAARMVAMLVGLALLLVGAAWAAWRAWNQPERVISHCFWLLVWVIFVCNPTTQAWYLVWPLAIGALQPWNKRLVMAMNLCACAGVLAYIVSSFVIPILGQ